MKNEKPSFIGSPKTLEQWRESTKWYLELLLVENRWNGFEPNKKYTDDELVNLLKRQNIYFSTFAYDGNLYIQDYFDIKEDVV